MTPMVLDENVFSYLASHSGSDAVVFTSCTNLDQAIDERTRIGGRSEKTAALMM